ncbi:MAG: AlwI family type II restriction endonuclease [Desulfobacteraceae bacterium]|nr:AlwI family type II restriction endonuclease [Desulfobacteraceae bacterium]
MPREATYKPLLFTTTLRNPERLKWFLAVLKEYDGQILDDDLARKISGEIIRIGLYKPTKLSASVKKKIKEKKPLTDKEVAKVLKDNPQNHKEAGFKKGWPSRFDTWFKIAKELSFVFYKTDGKIKFSEIGLKLVDNEHPEFEQQAFLNAFVKYQNNSPFRRVLNENVPLVLLLEVIKKLNSDKDFNDVGISKLELPLIIYWKDNDAEKLYLRIKKLRQDFGYSPSWEVVTDICRNEIMEGQDIVRSAKSIMVDYPDEFIRKMRLTGLISLRGGGRFIDINKNEQEKVDYVLKNYSDYKKYDTEESYFEYISTIDENLILFVPKPIPVSEQDKFLANWVGVYSWEMIKLEMLNLAKKHLTKDNILKYLSNPVRLEFLTALAVKSKFPDVKVIPNYPIDDEGIPTSTAGGVGNTGDIECFENINGILIEVTMSEGRTQTMMEVWPISRHLAEFGKKTENSMCYFVAPSMFSDSVKQIEYVKQTQNLFISPKTIEEFLEHLDSSNILYTLA